MDDFLCIKDDDLLGESYLVLTLGWDRELIESLGEPVKIQTFDDSPLKERLYLLSMIYDMEDFSGREKILNSVRQMREKERKVMSGALLNLERAYSLLAKWDDDGIFAHEPEEVNNIEVAILSP